MAATPLPPFYNLDCGKKLQLCTTQILICSDPPCICLSGLGVLAAMFCVLLFHCSILRTGLATATNKACTIQEEDRKELSLRAIVGLSPEAQEQVVGAAGQAEDKYRQAGHAAADQAEQGADAATAKVSSCNHTD